MTNRKAVNIFYVISGVFFVIQCIWSVVGISPFARIALYLLCAIFMYIGSAVTIRGMGEHAAQGIMKKTYFLMFVLYIVLFLALVFVDGYYEDDIRSAGQSVDSFKDYVENYLNLVPLKNTRGLLYSLKMNWISIKLPLLNIGGNLLLCMPFAFFLPLFFKKQHNFFVFFLTVTGISALVESIQLIVRIGCCDIDDLIFNVSGACVMFGILHIKPLRKLVTKIAKLEY